MIKVNSLGIMNGTSMDGVDFCLAEIELNDLYDFRFKIISEKYIPFDKGEKKMIRNALNNMGEFNLRLDDYLGKYYYKKIKKYFIGYNIDIVSIHGQTISHSSGNYSIQVGSPKYIYQELNLPVFYNFRKKDIDAGGSGAPLMPFLDWLLFKDINASTITLNIGGIANICYVPKNSIMDEVIGYDTGPGMSLIDECTKLFWNTDYDIDSVFSKKGSVNKHLLASLLNHDYLRLSAPKSTGRHEFGFSYINRILAKHESVNKYDIIRTLVYYSAKTITDCIKQVTNDDFFNLYINGGGKHHTLLLNDIFSMLNKFNYKDLADFNINSDFKEALLMSVLGVASLHGIKSNILSVTGAKFNVICGEIFNE